MYCGFRNFQLYVCICYFNLYQHINRALNPVVTVFKLLFVYVISFLHKYLCPNYVKKYVSLVFCLYVIWNTHLKIMLENIHYSMDTSYYSQKEIL